MPRHETGHRCRRWWSVGLICPFVHPAEDLDNPDRPDIETPPLLPVGRRDPNEPRMPVEAADDEKVKEGFHQPTPIKFPSPPLPGPLPVPNPEKVAASIREATTAFSLDGFTFRPHFRRAPWMIPPELQSGFDGNGTGPGSALERARRFVMAQQLETQLPGALLQGATRALDQAPSNFRQPGVQAGITARFVMDNQQDVIDMRRDEGASAFPSPGALISTQKPERTHPRATAPGPPPMRPFDWWGNIFRPAFGLIGSAVTAYGVNRFINNRGARPPSAGASRAKGGGGKGALRNTLDLISQGSLAIGKGGSSNRQVDQRVE